MQHSLYLMHVVSRVGKYLITELYFGGKTKLEFLLNSSINLPRQFLKALADRHPFRHPSCGALKGHSLALFPKQFGKLSQVSIRLQYFKHLYVTSRTELTSSPNDFLLRTRTKHPSAHWASRYLLVPSSYSVTAIAILGVAVAGDDIPQDITAFYTLSTMERRTTESPMDFEWERQAVPKSDSPFKHAFQMRSDGSQNFRTMLSTAIHVKDPQANHQRIIGAPATAALVNPSAFGTKPISIFSASAPKLQKQSSFGEPAASLNTPHLNRSSTAPTRGTFNTTRTKSSTSRFSVPEMHSDPEPIPEDNHGAKIPSTPPPMPSIHGLRINSPGMSDILSSPLDRKSGRGELRRTLFIDHTKNKILKRKAKSHSENWAMSSASRSNRNEYRDDGDDDGDEDEDDDPFEEVPNLRHKASRKSKGFFGTSATNWDPHAPVLILKWLQMLFSGAILGLVLYVVIFFVRTVWADVDSNVKREVMRATHEISDCGHRFITNNCDLSRRVPAMEQMCNEWERCMNQDPEEVGRARMSAMTFAIIINSFFETISYKALVSLVFLILQFILHGAHSIQI